LKNDSKKESGLERVFATWSVRSCFDRLSTNVDRGCRRVPAKSTRRTDWKEYLRPGASVHASTGSVRTETGVVEEHLSSPFVLPRPEPDEGGTSEACFSIRSPCPVLSLSKEAYRRVRIEKRFEERIRIGKTIHDLERPFLLRQAQYERK
jgi:hypothetical protein